MQPMSSDIQWAIELSPTAYSDGDLKSVLSGWIAWPWLGRVLAGIASSYRKPLGLVKALANSKWRKGRIWASWKEDKNHLEVHRLKRRNECHRTKHWGAPIFSRYGDSGVAD